MTSGTSGPNACRGTPNATDPLSIVLIGIGLLILIEGGAFGI